MNTQSLPDAVRLNKRITSHPSFGRYLRDDLDQLSDHHPIIQRARKWALDIPGLRDHGIQTLAYWGVTL